MATLAQIKAEVLRIVEDHIAELTGSALTTHVQRAQLAIESRCAFRVQHASTTISVTPAASSYDMPSDYIAVRKRPYFLASSTARTYSRLMEHEDFEDLGLLTEEGPPRFWRDADGDTVEFWPIGDGLGPGASGAYDIVFPYFKSLAPLAADEDTNFWSETMDDVLAFRAASFLFAEMRDPMANWWSSVAAARFTEIRNQNKRAQIRQRGMAIYPSEALSSQTKRMQRWSQRYLISSPI